MAALSIRNLDDDVKQRLHERAAQHGRSMEAEARAILEEAVRPEEEPRNFLVALYEEFQKLGGVELDIPRDPPGPPRVDFSGPEYAYLDDLDDDLAR